ncbi:MAG: right-handed parallel beta-helix repeat-containing protein [Candidatus Zixiibacteriota bacterium]
MLSVLIATSSSTAVTLTVQRGSDLQSVIDFASDGDTISLAPKIFTARPSKFIDPLCGNCEDPKTEATATRGYIIRNKALTIVGQSRTETILETKAGYGIYFENSYGSTLSNLTVTGGVRDADGNATDAAVVVRKSRVTVQGVNIINNDNRIDTVVVGIGGIYGREGAEINAVDCRIINNGWDGIALYRGAVATIIDCVIRTGRGAGIGVTWDASCVAYRNEVSGYWKGIGAFGNSWVIARNNLVRDNLGWGMIATGQSYMDMTNNVIYHNGNCGIAPWSSESRGRIVNNIITQNGWRDEWVCPCVGVWNYGDWAKWEFANNIVWGNKDDNYRDIWDHTGFNGNISEDPMFTGEGDFRLRDDSPAINGGNPGIFNVDGTISHIGLYGGPQAWRR